MGKYHFRRALILIFTVLIALTSLIGFSNIPTTAGFLTIHFPIINKLMPVGADISTDLLISEILFNPGGSEPGGEWVEIFNRSSKPIQLAGHKVGDCQSRGGLEGMYQFPEGAAIQPGEVMVIANQALLFSQKYGFIPDFELNDSDPSVVELTKYRVWSGGIINLNNAGDEIILLDPNDNFLDAISWGKSTFAFDPSAPATSDDHSLERIPGNVDRNWAGDWIVQPKPQPGSVYLLQPTPETTSTPIATPFSCQNAKILISEVLYDPVNPADPTGEWVELFNWGSTLIELGCLMVGDEEAHGGGEGMFAFPRDSSILSGEVILIVNRGDAFTSTYGFNPDFEIIDSDPDVPDMVKYSTQYSWNSAVN
jgi:hypothetical protein